MIRISHERTTPKNHQLAAALEEVADLLESQAANLFRVRAYRKAAETVRGLKGDVSDIVRAEGVLGLMQLPGIGRSLAHVLDHLVRTGSFPLLERLRGEDVAEKAFATVPDIGPELARRIHEELEIESLAELEAAAHDGRLARVPGMGSKRIRAVRESLAGRFALRRQPMWRTPGTPAGSEPQEQPQTPITELLDVDEEYRRLAKQGKLPRIAPRRFNPRHEAWLPVLHTVRGDRHYTALFSNTARAHEFGASQDWVVIYRDDPGYHGRWTVITANYGRLRGRRIVRSREQECEDHYSISPDATSPAPPQAPENPSHDTPASLGDAP